MNNVPGTDDCKFCKRRLPRQWIPPVLVAGRPLAGTGVWQSEVEEGRCAECVAAVVAERRKQRDAALLRAKLVRLFGGELPYQRFVFDRYQTKHGDRTAYERCKSFNPGIENLYLWGPCGTGKTHLALASARQCAEAGLSVTVLPPYLMLRQAPINDLKEAQRTIDSWIAVEVLVLDGVPSTADCPYIRQLLLEILDGRYYQGRAGLIITSIYSPESLAPTGNSTIASRLAGLCSVIPLQGEDHRVAHTNK